MKLKRRVNMPVRLYVGNSVSTYNTLEELEAELWTRIHIEFHPLQGATIPGSELAVSLTRRGYVGRIISPAKPQPDWGDHVGEGRFFRR